MDVSVPGPGRAGASGDAFGQIAQSVGRAVGPLHTTAVSAFERGLHSPDEVARIDALGR